MKKFLRANKRLFTILISSYLIILVVYGYFNYTFNKNMILTGNSGTGKTSLVNSIALLFSNQSVTALYLTPVR